MKPSHMTTPRTLNECTFTELNAYTPHIAADPERIVVRTAVAAFIVLIVLMAFGVVK